MFFVLKFAFILIFLSLTSEAKLFHLTEENSEYAIPPKLEEGLDVFCYEPWEILQDRILNWEYLLIREINQITDFEFHEGKDAKEMTLFYPENKNVSDFAYNATSKEIRISFYPYYSYCLGIKTRMEYSIGVIYFKGFDAFRSILTCLCILMFFYAKDIFRDRTLQFLWNEGSLIINSFVNLIERVKRRESLPILIALVILYISYIAWMYLSECTLIVIIYLGIKYKQLRITRATRYGYIKPFQIACFFIALLVTDWYYPYVVIIFIVLSATLYD